jgi:hypothetical protein
MTDLGKYRKRTIVIKSDQQKELACAAVRNAPAGVEVVIREPVRVRGLDANALMWVGPLKDIAEQAWYKDRQYSDVLWHETYKRLYLPEDYDAELTKDGYRKWDFDRDGNKVLIGSTTQLTRKGFAIYLEQIYADGAQMGVMFSASPNEAAR